MFFQTGTVWTGTDEDELRTDCPGMDFGVAWIGPAWIATDFGADQHF